MVSIWLKRFLAVVPVLALPLSATWAGPLLDQLQVADTCGTTYVDKLASCQPFRCQKPSPMADMFGYPSEAELKKMPPAQQQKMRDSMAEAEKKMAGMSPEKIASMKAKMISILEIKGRDAQGACQTITQAIPGQRMDCLLDKTALKDISDYTRLAATAEHITVSSTSHLVDGKMVTEQVDTLDGKPMVNPWQQAIENGQCKMIDAAVAAQTSSAPVAGKTANKPVGSSDSATTLFILDASGSMWGRINGQPKIAIAKDVMGKLVPELPDTTRIGLIAYGHRRKSDCEDVETLVKPGANDKQVVLKAVAGLNAKGKTPLTRSVNQAIDMLRQQMGASTVVLVSDGIESCGGDPCAAVKAAKASGVNFILHTVGFGLSKQESTQLECMAKAGGGEFFQANNAEELLKSTRKAVKSKGPGLLKLTLRANGKPVNAWVRLTGEGSIGVAGLTNDDGVVPGHSWRLTPGKYQLETYPAGLRGVEPMIIKGIGIESGKTVEKQLDFEQATLHLIATMNGKPVTIQVQLTQSDSGKVVFDTATFSTFTMNGVNTPYDVQLPPGSYHLKVMANEQGAPAYEEDIVLSAAGDPLEKRVNFEVGELRVLVTLDGKAVPAEVTIASKATQQKVFETMPYVGNNTPFSLKLTPGLYHLVAMPAGVAGLSPKTLEDVEVNATRPNALSLAFKRPQSETETDANGMEQNTDRPFGDYQRLMPERDDPVLCQQACRADARCKAWTYVKPNTVQGPEPHCYLKEIVPTASHNDCCVSGIRQE
ncbi:MAG: VWA domain-containing protein [Candidatus Thiodiazotropha sp.]